MKKLIGFLAVCMFLYRSGDAQKPMIDIYGESWERLGDFHISNDGQYIAGITNQPSGWNLYISSRRPEARILIPNAFFGVFTQDSRRVVYSKGDSVCIRTLRGRAQEQYFTGIKTYRLLKQGRDRDLLLYRYKKEPDKLIIRDIESGIEKAYPLTDNYWFSQDGEVIVLERVNKDSVGSPYVLDWLKPREGSLKEFWKGQKVGDLKLGFRDDQCVFLTKDGVNRSGDAVSALWLYSDHEKDANGRGEESLAMLPRMHIDKINCFNDLSGRVFVTAAEPEVREMAPDTGVSVDVWSYKDSILQSEQLALLKGHFEHFIYHKAVVNLKSGDMIQLEHSNEGLLSELYTDREIRYVLVSSTGGGSRYEWNWNKKSETSIYLVDLDNGKRQLIADSVHMHGLFNYTVSYNEHYIYYYDGLRRGYYSYRISDGIRENLTRSIRGSWTDDQLIDIGGNLSSPYSVAGLLRHTDAILVYSRNDIYQLDPTRHIQAKNLTERWRQSHDWVFRLATNANPEEIDTNDPVCISILNRPVGNTCVTSMQLGPVSSIGPKAFVPYSYNALRKIEKARDTDVYVVGRMSAEESPNLFVTTDFIKYTSATDLHPERKYNWMKSELVSWRTFGGLNCQGILYKPEDFNAHKSYPMLVYYYQMESENLHGFISPSPSSGDLNIPYYVSHGYLVFVPDIHYARGWPGRSAYECVVSGVQFLLKRSYVDRNHLGLQGHSFGGLETNYIVAHSHLFAAAMSASAVSDLVSNYNSITTGGFSRQPEFEVGQNRIGASLWAYPRAYIDNSAVFNADRISTPMLLLANKDDRIIRWDQGLELFLALRRLGKKAWLLQYDGEGHGVSGAKAQRDLTLRMAQFFNYYLKGELPPRWMTVGVPADKKKIYTGLEVDSTGLQP